MHIIKYSNNRSNNTVGGVVYLDFCLILYPVLIYDDVLGQMITQMSGS